MPEIPYKTRPHPAKARPAEAGLRRQVSVHYAELTVTSNFTFLTGASHPDELVAQAAATGCAAVAITDANTLGGVVRAHVAARETGIPLVVGCRLELEKRGQSPFSTTAKIGTVPIFVYPTDLKSYGRLCRLLTRRNAELHHEGTKDTKILEEVPAENEKNSFVRPSCPSCLGGESASGFRIPNSEFDRLLADNAGLLAAVAPPEQIDDGFLDTLARLREAFDDDRLSLAASRLYGHDDRGRIEQLADLARRARVPLVATNDVHYHVPRRRPLQDVLTCIRHGCTIADAGLRLLPNAERHIKSPEEMACLFAAYPGAIERTMEIARRASPGLNSSKSGFSLDQLRYQYPHELCPPGLSPIEHLRQLTFDGARERYPQGLPAKVRSQLEHELALIDELNYAPYFLTVHDLVRFARSRSILCQGRGAAANSAVCFCLGVTCVDPGRIDVLFERFISRERNEPPDIDIDFEHERREEVIQYIYSKYGRHRAALTAEVITYRGRLAVREVGKALGLSADCVDRLAKAQDWWDDQPVGPEILAQAGLDVGDPTIASLVLLTNELMGFPRHLSQHVGGFVITHDPLCELVPIVGAAMPGRTIIEWDKDDIDALGMLKVDCLGLGMLTCIRKCLELVNRNDRGGEFHHEGTKDTKVHEDVVVKNEEDSFVSALCPSCLGGESSNPQSPLTLATIPPEDPSVYDMICAADTVGVFQIESRAQMSMLPRLRPRCFYDLVIEVGIVRPGPIVGDMVHPYLRRRQGLEPVEYPNEAIRAVLDKTLGVPLFQEQAMKLAMVAGGFSPGQADQLRRAIASRRSREKLEQLGKKLVEGMLANGCSLAFAEKCFQQFQGFSHYGFPESHAASFALLVYASAWLKKHHPAAFAAALLNSQPMGFYAPAQIIGDAQRHGVTALPVDVNFSGWDCRLEEESAKCKMQNAKCKMEDQPRPDGQPAPSIRNPQSEIRNSFAIRLGMRMVKGLSRADADAIERATAAGRRFGDIDSLYRASRAKTASLRCLASADAFRSMGLGRQAALWQIRALRDDDLPLFAAIPPLPLGEGWVAESPWRREGASESPTAGNSSHSDHSRAPSPGLKPTLSQGERDESVIRNPKSEMDFLPAVNDFQKVLQDYRSTGVSLRGHPIGFLRAGLQQRNVVTTAEVRDPRRQPAGSFVRVAGVVLVRQRPSSAAGVLFLTVEDEAGPANILIRPSHYARMKKALSGNVIICSGKLERVGQVAHVLASHVEDISQEIRDLAVESRNFR